MKALFDELRSLALLITANAVPVVLAKLAQGRGALPLDFGFVMPDGQRLLGSHKTWRGLLSGSDACAHGGCGVRPAGLARGRLRRAVAGGRCGIERRQATAAPDRAPRCSDSISWARRCVNALMTFCQKIGWSAMSWGMGKVKDVAGASAAPPSGWVPVIWMLAGLALAGLVFSFLLWRDERGPRAHGLEMRKA